MIRGKTLQTIEFIDVGPPDPAWIDSFTLPIQTSIAYLRFSSHDIFAIRADEFDIPNRKYPSLGLSILKVNQAPSPELHKGMDMPELIRLNDPDAVLPDTIIGTQNSDPLGEGAISQFLFELAGGNSFVFRHVFPPTTLGIDIVVKNHT